MNCLFNNKYKICNSLIGLVIIFCLSIVQSFAADAKGSKDHPLVPRYDGSYIKYYNHSAFDEYPLFIDKITDYKGIESQPDSAIWLEGRVTKFLYINPPERSHLEVFRNYEKALNSAGFETIFECKKKSCGGHHFKNAFKGYIWMTSDNQHYLAAILPRDEGDVYVSLFVTPSGSGGGPDYKRILTQLHVIEIEPMEEKMVTIDAVEMNKSIDKEGRVALYGILFDVDKDTIKPESKPSLEQITAMLTNNPEMKIVIVGHTDNQGEIRYNMDLSTRRAKSVEATLVDEYGISRERLSAWGVGYLSPVASNHTKAGQAKNRRVELVEE